MANPSKAKEIGQCLAPASHCAFRWSLKGLGLLDQLFCCQVRSWFLLSNKETQRALSLLS